MIFRVGKPRSKARSAGRDLYAAAVRQSRAVDLYQVLGAPDTTEGHFELLTLHVILLIEGLRALGPAARSSSQALFDTYVSDLDGALREMGVGDLTVGKRMRALGRAFYGRAIAYREALEALPEREPLEAVIGRTVMGGQVNSNPTALAAYVTHCHDALTARDAENLLETPPRWPSV
ncbi:MAG TPA: ubiquinol-cytochrome C chaperone family protein [Caulobacteraceae bacterium]